jgi:hypothetical protein
MSAIEGDNLPLDPEASKECKPISSSSLRQSSKPIVWHMYGADINIRIVDGVPHVNGDRVESAVGGAEKFRK